MKMIEKELIELVKLVSEYRTLKYQQLLSYFPLKKRNAIGKIIKNLIKQNRFYYDLDTGLVSIRPDFVVDDEMLKAFDVLIDLKEDVDFHMKCELPVKIMYLNKDCEEYEIIVVSIGKESMYNSVFKQLEATESRRIIVIDELEQSSIIKIPNVTCYCTIENGQPDYYKL